MAKIIIEREFGYLGLMRRIVIEVNGKRCAKVWLNGRAERTIAPGLCIIQARMDWVKSAPIQIAIGDGDAVGIVCRAWGVSSSGRVSLRKVFHSRAEATSNGQAQQEKADRYEQEEHSIGDQPAPWNLVLEVRADASIEEIRNAYRQHISEYHPDKVATLGKDIREVAERRSKEINIAYSSAMRQRGEH